MTLLFLLQLSEKEWIFIDHFCGSVKSLYITFVRKLKSKFYFKSRFLTNLKFINPSECQSFSLNTSDEIHASIFMKFAEAATKLEFRKVCY